MSAGYNYPGYTVNPTNLKEIYKSGEIFQVAVQRSFKKFYAHSFGVGYINRRINFLMDVNTSSTSNEFDYKKYNYSNGSLQLNYLGKFYPVEKNGFAINFGLTLEKVLFSDRKISGISQKTSNQEDLFYDFGFNLGISYDWKINENWTIYSQFSGAKSFYSLFESYFDPKYGRSYGTIDYRAKIGMIYQLSDSIKTPKEIRKYSLNNKRNPTVHAFELKSIFTSGNRNLIIPGDSADNAYPCGYCSAGYSLPKSVYKYYGVGVGLNYSYERFFSTLEISLERYNGNLESYYGVSYFHPQLPYGTITDYYREKDFFSFEMSRLNYSVGLGIKIFSPQRKFNIIPTLKFTGGRLLDFQVNSSYYTKERYRYWDQAQDPAFNFSWDSIRIPSRFSEPNQKNSSILFGAIFTTTVYKKINLNAEMFFATKSSSIFSNSSVPFVDKLKYTFSIGVSYLFPISYQVKSPEVKPPI